MPSVEVKCPTCSQNVVVKFGTSPTGKQRYQCKNSSCDKNTFILDYSRNGDIPGVVTTHPSKPFFQKKPKNP